MTFPATGRSPVRAPWTWGFANPCCRLSLLLAFALAGLQPCAQAERTVRETESQWLASGDWDGDGRMDLVVVDKLTGSFRIGLTVAAGQLQWAESESVGLSPVSALTVGRFASRSSDVFVVAEPTANRVHEVLWNGSAQITALYPTQIGPSLIVSVESGFPGGSTGEELLMATSMNSSPANQLGLYNHPAGSLDFVGGLNLFQQRATSAQSTTPDSSAYPLVALLLRGDASTSWRLLDLHTGSIHTAVELPGLNPGTEFILTTFPEVSGAQLLTWEPADPSGTLQLRSLVSGAPGTWTLGPARGFTLGAAIRHLFVPNPATSGELVAELVDGSVRTFAFNGTANPSPVATLAHAANGSRSPVPLESDRMVLVGMPSSSTPETFQVLSRSGGTWHEIQVGKLPDLVPLRGRINLWEFQEDPFVSTHPGYLGGRSIDDWTTSAEVGALPQLRVHAEQFEGIAEGLGNPVTRELGPADAGTRHLIVNQIHPSMSVFGLERVTPPGTGTAIPSPPPGTYSRSVPLEFQIAPSTAVGLRVLFRFDNQGDWRQYAAPIRLYRETTVSYFVEDSRGTRSSIATARYAFRDSPGRLDADLDGVPDYVEVSLGLDPTAGPDTDLDGIRDLDEIVAGTDPALASSHPPFRTGLANAGHVTAMVTPRVYHGLNRQLQPAQAGTPVEAFTAQGVSLDRALIIGGPAQTTGFATLTQLPRIPSGRVFNLATPPNFQGLVATPSENPNFGREMLVIRTAPGGRTMEVTFNWTSGEASSAAAIWRATAVRELGRTEPAESWEISPLSTLVALLFEQRIESLLHTREILPASRSLSLFPHRNQDLGRHAVSDADLFRLESPDPTGAPVYELRPLLAAIETSVNGPGAAALREVALDIYGTSSRELDAPSSLPLPVDALREWLRRGTLPPGYAAKSTLSPETFRVATTAVATALAAPVPRTYLNLSLTLTSQSTTGSSCTILGDDSGNAWALVNSQLEAWPLFDAFALPVGSRLRVRGFPMGASPCGTRTLLVHSIGFEQLPSQAPNDTDADLLEDAWERRYFGSLTENGSGDPDADGFPNLQEYLEGTNPMDATSRGSQAMVLATPALALEITPAGTLRLRFDWPEPYASRIRLEVLASQGLDQNFGPTGLGPTRQVDGALALELPQSQATSQFFIIRLSLP